MCPSKFQTGKCLVTFSWYTLCFVSWKETNRSSVDGLLTDTAFVYLFLLFCSLYLFLSSWNCHSVSPYLSSVTFQAVFWNVLFLSLPSSTGSAGRQQIWPPPLSLLFITVTVLLSILLQHADLICPLSPSSCELWCISVFLCGRETRGPSEAHLTLPSPFSIDGPCKVLYGVMNFYLVCRGSSPVNGENAGQWMCAALLKALADKLWWSGGCCKIFWWNLVQWTLNWQLLVREMELEIIRSVPSSILWCWVLSDALALTDRLSKTLSGWATLKQSLVMIGCAHKPKHKHENKQIEMSIHW